MIRRLLISALAAALLTSSALAAGPTTPKVKLDTAGNTVKLDPANATVTVAAGGNPCHNPGAALTTVTGSTSGTTAVQLIALNGTTKIYVCSMTITGVSGTTPTFSLVYGTGSNCGTGQAVLIGAWTTAANTLYQFAPPVAVTPAGQALCYLQTGTTPVSRYAITYVQQ